MKCRRVVKMLPLYMSGEIPDKKSRKVGLHLETCEACRTQFESYCGIRFNLRSLKQEPLEETLDGFYETIRSRVEPIPLRPGRRSARVNPFGRVSLVAASLLLAAVAGWALTLQGEVRTGTPDLTGSTRLTVPPPALTGSSDETAISQPRLYFPVSRTRPKDLPARSVHQLSILAGPGVPVVSVPLERPVLPATRPVPRVQPYSWPVQRSTPVPFAIY